MSLPDIESLRCFEAAAVNLNFRKAAAAVALSPAAFGDRIRRLEDQIGSALFERTTRRVALTRAGRRLLPEARQVIEAARRCLGVASGQPAPYELTIGTRFELGLSWLTPALGPLSRLQPHRSLHLSFGDSEDLLARVRQGRIDGAVTSIRLSTSNLHYELLHPEDYVFVGKPNVLGGHPVRRAADAAFHVLLDTLPDLPLFRYLLDSRPAGESWRWRRQEYLGTIGAVKYRVLEGVGVAVLPRYFVAKELGRRQLVEILPRSNLQTDHFRLIWRAGHPQEDELRTLAGELRQIPLS